MRNLGHPLQLTADTCCQSILLAGQTLLAIRLVMTSALQNYVSTAELKPNGFEFGQCKNVAEGNHAFQLERIARVTLVLYLSSIFVQTVGFFPG